MYAVISNPLESLTRATLRRAELGFLGVFVYTRVHTPRRCGAPLRAGVLVFFELCWRPLRTNCEIVGTGPLGERNFVSTGRVPPRQRPGGRRVMISAPRAVRATKDP